MKRTYLCRNCTAVNKHKEHDATFCITVGVETSGSQIELDIVKDGVVPFLLATLVKGGDYILHQQSTRLIFLKYEKP